MTKGLPLTLTLPHMPYDVLTLSHFLQESKCHLNIVRRSY